MYTLFLRYTIDPNKLPAWRTYAEAELSRSPRAAAASLDIIRRPTSPAPPAKRSLPSMSAPWPKYEVYRAKLAAHPKHEENVRTIEASGAIHSIYRAIIEMVEPGGIAK
jgi:hypothetical protein